MMPLLSGVRVLAVLGSLLMVWACGSGGASRPPPVAAPSASGAVAATESPSPAVSTAGDERAVAGFYQGKTVRIVVGYPPGGGFDVISRVIAKTLPKYIPGNPTVIVDNMPGAASMVGLNYVYNVAPKDGTVIANSIGGQALQQAFGTSGVQFDMGQMHYLGTSGTDTFVLFVNRATTGVSTMEEILGGTGREIALGASAPGATQTDAAVLVRDVLGARVKPIMGYQGTAPIRLGIESGELDGMVQVWEDMKRTDRERFESGEWVPLTVFSEEPLADLPNLPSVLSFARTEEQRQLFRLGVLVPTQILRPYMLAPQVPPARVRALQGAFAQTMQDPDYLTEARRANLPLDPLTGEETLRLVREVLSMPADVRDKLKTYLQPQ
jgi:tripartite-type tricarboxylate transporter receptor subunit TctC